MAESRRILLIDDRAERRELLRVVLRASIESEITAPPDPVTVGECLRDPSPHVVVLAHPCPWLPGFDLTRRVVEAFPGVPRVLLVEPHRSDAHAVARDIAMCRVVSADPGAALQVRDAVVESLPVATPFVERRTTVAAPPPAPTPAFVQPLAPPPPRTEPRPEYRIPRSDEAPTMLMPAIKRPPLHRTTDPATPLPNVVELDPHRVRARASREEDEPVTTIREARAERLEDILADLESGSTVQLEVEEPDADCELLLDEVRATLSRALQETGGRVTSGPLPVLPVPANQVAQVLQILVSNALKYRSERAPAIHVRAERDSDKWQLQVEDNGRGVAAEARDRIFERFQRGEVGDRVPGTGIGLSVCKRIVESHGGRIWVKPAASGGSVFTFTIPFADTVSMQA